MLYPVLRDAAKIHILLDKTSNNCWCPAEELNYNLLLFQRQPLKAFNIVDKKTDFITQPLVHYLIVTIHVIPQ